MVSYDELIAQALDAREYAYTPYSHQSGRHFSRKAETFTRAAILKMRLMVPAIVQNVLQFLRLLVRDIRISKPSQLWVALILQKSYLSALHVEFADRY